jgi:hypothetical protein
VILHPLADQPGYERRDYDPPIYTVRWSGSETMYYAAPCPLAVFAGMCEMVGKVVGETQEEGLWATRLIPETSRTVPTTTD